MKATPKIFTIKDLLGIARRQAKGMAILFAIVVAIGIFTYLGSTRFYQSTVEMQVTSSDAASGGDSSDPVNQVTRPNQGTDLATQIAVLQSTKILSDAFSKAGIVLNASGDFANKPTIDVSEMGKATVLQISVVSPDYQLAQRVAGTIPDAYLAYLEQQQQGEVDKALTFLNQRLAVEGALYSKQLNQLNAFKLSRGLSNQSNEETARNGQVQSSNQEVANANNALIAAKLKLSTLESQRNQLTGLVQNPTVEVNTAALEAQRNLITTQKAQIASLMELYQPTSRKVMEAQRELKVEEQRLDSMPKEINVSGTTKNPLLLSLQSSIIDAKAAVNATQATYNEVLKNHLTSVQKLQNYHKIEPEQSQLEQNVALTQASVASVKNDIAALEVRRNSAKSPITILNGPTSAVKVKPILSQYAILTVLLGVLLMVGFALLKDSLDESFHSSAEVADVTEALIIGEIPSLPARATSLVRKELEVVANQAYSSACFTVLEAIQNEIPTIIMVTSCELREGKSNLAMNLALTAAVDYDRVLLVDLNPTENGLAKMVDDNPGPGVAQIMEKSDSLVNCIQRIGNDTVSFLPYGKNEMPAVAGLSKNRLSSLMEELRASADVIVIEVPPYYSALTKQLASMVDGTVLSCRLGAAKRNEMKDCVDMLRGKDQPILGVVVSDKSSKRVA